MLIARSRKEEKKPAHLIGSTIHKGAQLLSDCIGSVKGVRDECCVSTIGVKSVAVDLSGLSESV